MATFDLVDWAVRALSLFNTIALLWLGLTVLLNAERRTWGTWVVGGGLVLASLFFAGHSALVAGEFGTASLEMEFWWRASLPLFVIHPYLWYLTMAWYSGVLGTRRHRIWLVVVSLCGAGALALIALANPLPGYSALLHDPAGVIRALGGMPIGLLVYPLFSALCIVLALDMLRRPGTSERFMGDLARRRARAWLVAASLALLGVSVAIGAVAIWLIVNVQPQAEALSAPQMVALLRNLDLLVSALLAVVVVLMGRAVVSYEIFTGKVLPRGGLSQHWRNSLVLATGYAAVVALSLALPVDAIYRLLLATVLLTLFYALLSWRSYVEREQGMARLRPFVASQRLYEHLIGVSDPLEAEAKTPFRALCDDVLGTRRAYLVALGPLAALAGPPLVFPEGSAPPGAALAALGSKLRESTEMCLPLNGEDYGGARWAVPLWSERGMIGALLLGEKRDGALYTQEEIEVARAAGERLIDTQASVEMARRLMGLQRQRLAESQVVDQRARRALHDDILPRLHTALLGLSGAPGDGTAEVVATLADVHQRIAGLLRAMPSAAAPELGRLGLLGTLRQAVALELGMAFDGVEWRITPEGDRVARSLPALTAEVVFGAAREAIRNAAQHGRDEAAPLRELHLTVSVQGNEGLRIEIEDDGIGVGAGNDTGAGGGHGLALHSTLMAVVGGALSVESVPKMGTRVVLVVPGAAEAAQV